MARFLSEHTTTLVHGCNSIYTLVLASRDGVVKMIFKTSYKVWYRAYIIPRLIIIGFQIESKVY